MIKKRSGLKVAYGATFDISIRNLKLEKPYRPYDVKCDRSSPLGNPFHLKGVENRRNKACDDYEQWFQSDVLTYKNWPAYEELMRLRWLFRKHKCLRIFCWCTPKRCHTETIQKWLLQNK